MRARSGIVGTSLVVVVLACLSPSAAAVPGQNGKLAFESSRGMIGIEVFVMNPDGTNPLRLTDSSGWNRDPVWSPDGTRIAFWSTREDAPGIYVMNADGSSQVRVLDHGTHPAWSPDGTKIAFSGDAGGIYVMDADGSGEMVITGGDAYSPAWSPDGTKFAYVQPFSAPGIWVVNADGSDMHQVTTDPPFAEAGDADPTWSPDGTKIAFSRYIGSPNNYEIFVVNANGGGEANLTNDANSSDGFPAWSPDGKQLTYSRWWPQTEPGTIGRDVAVMNADGTNQVTITSHFNVDTHPDWQPIPINSYPRPRGATPVRAALVVSFGQCDFPNRTHGPPLAFPSCSDAPNSPRRSSPHVTVGTPDFNGAAAGFTGVARLDVVVGDPGTPADEADVLVATSLTDIRCNPNVPAICGLFNSAASRDYSGELGLALDLRLTDKDNTPNPGGPGAATTQDFDLRVAVPCVETSASNIGSTCSVATSYDALVPGTVKEGRRSIWQLGRVEVYDGGTDGDVDTPTGDTVFATQGLLVP